MTGGVPVVVPQVVTAHAGAVLQQGRTLQLLRVWQQLLAVWHGAGAWQHLLTVWHGAGVWQHLLAVWHGAAATWQPVLQVETWSQQLLRVFVQHLRAYASVAVMVMAVATTHKQIKFFMSKIS